MASQILPMCNGAASRARVFERQGVTLTFPAQSRSGVRDHDGMVVFAMAAADVLSDDWGFSCLLWRPGARGTTPGEHEMLEHCRLAVRRGGAEGFLLYADGAKGDEGLLSLRIVRAGVEYWARWGRGARAAISGDAKASAGVRI